MKHNSEWHKTSESYDPLTLMKLIKKTILSWTKDQYMFATIYKQEANLYLFSQQTMSNKQWYKRFNTKVDVGTAIGVMRQYQAILDHVASEKTSAITTLFADLSNAKQVKVTGQAEETYLAYFFLQQSGKQHNKLKTDVQNNFTTGDDRYPKNRQAVLHLLDKYSKSAIQPPPISKGTAFAQRGGRGGGRGSEGHGQSQQPFDKEYWKDKECYNCHKKGHPSTHCPKAKDDDGD